MGSQEPGPGWRVNERPTTAHYAGPARLGGSILGSLGLGHDRAQGLLQPRQCTTNKVHMNNEVEQCIVSTFSLHHCDKR